MFLLPPRPTTIVWKCTELRQINHAEPWPWLQNYITSWALSSSKRCICNNVPIYICIVSFGHAFSVFEISACIWCFQKLLTVFHLLTRVCGHLFPTVTVGNRFPSLWWTATIARASCLQSRNDIPLDSHSLSSESNPHLHCISTTAPCTASCIRIRIRKPIFVEVVTTNKKKSIFQRSLMDFSPGMPGTLLANLVPLQLT